MPYKKKNHGTRRKRKATIPKRMNAGMPTSVKMDFKFADTIKLPSVTGIASHTSYSGNGLAIPDASATSHQPFGYDQWDGFFDSYTVTGSTIKVAAVGDTRDVMVTVRPQTSTSYDSKIYYSIERPNTMSKLVSTDKPHVFKKTMSTLKVLGRPKSQDAEVLSASYGNNPVTQWFWMIQHAAPDDIATDLNLVIEITYHTLLRRRNRMTSS